ncbi:MAG: FAD-binding protein, partial [Polyangiaceae bacterium]
MAVPVPAMTRTLLSVGGLYEATARVHRPRSLDELAAVFADARQKGKQLTLVGAGRSFGRQFLPPEGVDAVDTTALPGQTTLNERTADGLWVRAPGGRTFEELWRDVPNHLPRHAPTGDRITIAGALAACSHNTRDFFTRDVRSFRVMTPDGAVVDCRPDAQGLGG